MSEEVNKIPQGHRGQGKEVCFMTGLRLPLCLLIVLTYCEEKGLENNPGEYLIRFL